MNLSTAIVLCKATSLNKIQILQRYAQTSADDHADYFVDTGILEILESKMTFNVLILNCRPKHVSSIGGGNITRKIEVVLELHGKLVKSALVAKNPSIMKQFAECSESIIVI